MEEANKLTLAEQPGEDPESSERSSGTGNAAVGCRKCRVSMYGQPQKAEMEPFLGGTLDKALRAYIHQKRPSGRRMFCIPLSRIARSC